MKTFLALFVASVLGLAFAIPAPQQIAIELGHSFRLTGLDSATFEDLTFKLESVNITGDNPQVMLAITTNESEVAEMVMLETPMAASVAVGEYTLTLLGASVPENQEAMCAVSSATLMLEKTEEDL